MVKGKIIQVSGPVVDVEFEDNNIPFIKDALEVDNNGKRCVMEVAQHMGNNVVRCFPPVKVSAGIWKSQLPEQVSKCLLVTRLWDACSTY